MGVKGKEEKGPHTLDMDTWLFFFNRMVVPSSISNSP